MAAERGYVVVIQDTRGRWNSEGERYPFIYEKNDGYDTVEWAAHQPWANGKVGMFGGSYVGYTQLAAAVTHPPSLVTLTPIVTFCDPHAVAESGGAPFLGVPVAWTLLVWAMLEIFRLPPAEQPPLMAQLIDLVDGMASGETFRQLPLRNLPLIGEGGLTPFLMDSIPSPRRDALWQGLHCPQREINLPAFHIGGWYDIFIASTLRDFTAIRTQGHPQQKLLIGPWTHSVFESAVGEADFGLQANGMFFIPEEMLFRWFDYWLKGMTNGAMDGSPIRIFVMGEQRWRDESEWPLARTRFTPFYLHSSGAANTLHGDGLLSPEKPSIEAVDTFLYDPRNPTPTRGGAMLGWRGAMPDGVYDQRPVEARPDVLVYTTPALQNDMEVTGYLEVHLWAATTAPETDFTAKLVDVHPDGYAQNIQDGIVRVRPSAGEIQEYTIDLAATSNLFKAGHRIRLEISSSNFPRFDRNLNTGSVQWQEAELRPALQTILHDAEHPSHIILPIIPR
jgi:putative CocE/NonD family hydrolase